MPALMVSLPEKVPADLQPPGLSYELKISITDGGEKYAVGSGTLHYRYDSSSAYSNVPVVSLGGNLYGATLPNTEPGDEPEFYFSAKTTANTTIYLPSDAPIGVYSFEIGFLDLLMTDNFETDMGWTIKSLNLTDGEWERGVPAGLGDRGDPTSDYDGSGKCYLTDNVAGNSDVDGGPTMLTSPTIDLSTGDALIGYYRWHDNDDNDDDFTVEVSNDNGTTWTVVEKVKDTDGWNNNSFMVSKFVAPGAQIKVRFSSTDNPNNSVTESGLDAFTVSRLDTNPSFWADAYTGSTTTAATVSFTFDAGVANANRKYIILGTMSGTSPGFNLPGGTNVPLNWDVFTNVVLNSMGSPAFLNFLSTLNGAGRTTAAMTTIAPLDPALKGTVMNFATVLSPPPGWNFVSNPISIVIE